jgi:hypothetical protein
VAAWRASHQVVRRVRDDVAARLELAALFGSRARGDARPGSDVDLLLVFDRLPPDREPHASQAEAIADEVARETGLPLSVWSVSREDLRRGRRTPMLVDALEDAVPLWPRRARVPRVPFTPLDAAYCVRCLLDRVEEGSVEVARARRDGHERLAYNRAREDVVRLCTGALLLEGVTRPRREEAVRALRRRWPHLSRHPVIAWAARGGPDGRVGGPPWAAVAALVDGLRGQLALDLGGGAGLASQGGVPQARTTGRFPRIAP